RRRVALASRSSQDAVDVFGDCTDIIGRKINGGHRRHSGIASSVANHRLDQFSRLIVHCDFGSKQVGPSLIAATKIRAVTCTAVNPIKSVASGDECRVSWWSLLSRETLSRGALRTASSSLG